MIRRDYLLRMIEEFCQALARIRSAKKGQRWSDADDELDGEFKKLVGENAGTVARLSETELLARLMQDGPTHLLRDKTLMLTTLLREAGDVAAGENRLDDSRACHLKALHVLLDILGRDDVFECPEFVPNVERLRQSLQDEPLPVRTLAMLMQHYERTGEFAKAEDALHGMLDAEPVNGSIVDFGIAFYKRLLTKVDTLLDEGALPRTEVEEGLKELRVRRSKSPVPIAPEAP